MSETATIYMAPSYILVACCRD